MDELYAGMASVFRDTELLARLHADVTWHETEWWGVLTSDVDAGSWQGANLRLKIPQQPEGSIVTTEIERQGSTWIVHCQGSGPAPFWAARDRDELIQALVDHGIRRPSGDRTTPVFPDEATREVFHLLTGDHHMSAEDILDAIEQHGS